MRPTEFTKKITGATYSHLLSDFGFRISGFGFQVSGSGIRVPGFVFRVSGLEVQCFRHEKTDREGRWGI